MVPCRSQVSFRGVAYGGASALGPGKSMLLIQTAGRFAKIGAESGQRSDLWANLRFCRVYLSRFPLFPPEQTPSYQRPWARRISFYDPVAFGALAARLRSR